MAVDSPTHNDHDGEVCPHKHKLNETSPILIKNKLKRQSQCKYRAWRCAKATNKAKGWAWFETIKKETKKINWQACQNIMKDIIAKETTNNLWWLQSSQKQEMQHSWYIFPLERNGLTFGESRAKADIFNDQFCNVLIREDLGDLHLKRASTRTCLKSWSAKRMCTSYHRTWTKGKSRRARWCTLSPSPSSHERTCTSPDPTVKQLHCNRLSTPTMDTYASTIHLQVGEQEPGS